jgi:hypothetical protein
MGQAKLALAKNQKKPPSGCQAWHRAVNVCHFPPEDSPKPPQAARQHCHPDKVFWRVVVP